MYPEKPGRRYEKTAGRKGKYISPGDARKEIENQNFIRYLSEYIIFHDAEKDPTRIFESKKTQDLY
jgi:hypothetical protein